MTVKQIHAAQALLRIINILELSILSQSKCKAFKGEPYYATVDCEPFSQRSFPLEGEHIAALLYRSSPIRPLASSRAALFFSPQLPEEIASNRFPENHPSRHSSF